jgi:hypothetical protein
MDKEEFLALVKQYSNETTFLSFTDYGHPAFIKLLSVGYEIIPWLLGRLQDSVGHDHGDTMDRDNCPWLTIALLAKITDGECLMSLPEEHAGKLDEVRGNILQWGRQHKLLK